MVRPSQCQSHKTIKKHEAVKFNGATLEYPELRLIAQLQNFRIPNRAEFRKGELNPGWSGMDLHRLSINSIRSGVVQKFMRNATPGLKLCN